MSHSVTPPAERLDTLMEEKEISNRELARRLAGKGAPREKVESLRSQVSRWRSGQRTMSAKNARRVAKVLGLSPDELVTPRATRAGLETRLAGVEDEVQELRAAMGRIQRRLAHLARLLREPNQAGGQ